ncbi:MAG: MAPEG family protein [Gammaproteobacteria bacterium]|nr:MAPEG family protein [Gammaproteobacteria bacterium]
MPTLLYVLFAVSFLPILLAWLGGYFRVRQFGRMDNHYPRRQQAELKGVGARVQAAQMNAWESLIVFTAVSFIAFASGLDLHTLNAVAWLFLGFRILHAVFYIADLASLRSLAYTGGMGCCVYVFYRAAMGG